MIKKQQMYRGLVGLVALSLLAQGCGLRSPGQNSSGTASDPAYQTVAPAQAKPEALEPVAPAEAPQDDAKVSGLASSPAPEAAPAARLRRERADEAEMEFTLGAKQAKRSAAGAGAPMKAGSALVAPAPSGVLQGPVAQQPGELNTESYDATQETPFVAAKEAPLSTFSIDVDTASYSNVRRFLTQGQLPPSGAVRVEELVNYFSYAYPEPQGDVPFSITTEISQAPWNPKHQLLLVGLQGKHLAPAQLPPRNLVFLLDVSGSMNEPNKLPLLKRSLSTLVGTLNERDQVAIVVYAGASGVVLSPTAGHHQSAILAALDRLEAGGSTNGGQGIELAYSLAQSMARPGSMTRVVLATDGDFNVGVTNQSELFQLIEQKRKSGVFLSVLGFGMGNYKDSTLELLADKGNGNYAYIDTLAEARKVLVAQAGATLSTLAKDVKLQLEFNPAKVGAYRLIGYENRRLAARDFNDDAKDAGELGAGHSVTALYEIVPPGMPVEGGQVDALRYQAPAQALPGHGSELCSLKLRYKEPSSEQSKLVERLVQEAKDGAGQLSATTPSFRFAAAVAVFGMTLRESPARGSASFALARQLAEGALGNDSEGYRREFLGLVDTARGL
ncbi:MAG: VWA domain-containing protein, partial [Deltaproteobacteria bacterium]